MAEPHAVRTLIIDHDPSSRHVLRQLVEGGLGWPVVGEARDATEAIRLLRFLPADLLMVGSNPARAGSGEATGRPGEDDLAELTAELGAPLVAWMLDFPHEHAAAQGVGILKGAPIEHIRRVILEALAAPGGPFGTVPDLPPGDQGRGNEPPTRWRWGRRTVRDNPPRQEGTTGASGDHSDDVDPAEGEGQLTSRAIHSPSREVRRRALLRMSSATADRPALELVAQAVGDPDPELRHLALQILETAPALAPRDGIRRACLDSDATVRVRGLLLLGEAGDAGDLRFVSARAQVEQDSEARTAALRALARLLSRHGPGALDPNLTGSLISAFAYLMPDVAARHRDEFAQVALGIGRGQLGARAAESDTRTASGAAVLLGTLPPPHEPAPVVAEEPAPAPEEPGPAPEEPGHVPPPAPEEPAAPAAGEPAAPGAQEPGPVPPVPPPAAPPEPPLLDGLRDALRHRTPLIGVLLSRASEADLAGLAPDMAEVVLDAEARDLGEQVGRVLREHGLADALFEEWMGDVDPRRRQRACQLLGALSGLSGSSLDRALSDPSIDVRLAGLDAMPRPLTEEDADRLISVVVSDSSVPVVLDAADKLRSMPAAVRLRAAAACLRHRDSEVRLAGVGLVPPTAEGAETLLDCLTDREPRVAKRAGESLLHCPPVEVVVMLWSALRAAPPQTAELVVELLGRIDAGAARRLGRRSVDSLDGAERKAGLEMLIRLRDEGLQGHITRALSDPDRTVRLTAVALLRQRPELVQIPEVGGRARDPDPEVRRLAVEVLVATDDDAVVPYLLDAGRDPVPEVSAPARRFLRARTTGWSAELLVQALADPARRGVATELLQASPQAAVGMILRQLPEADEDTRAAMALVLDGQGARPLLESWLRHPDPERRSSALTGFELVANAGDVELLALVLQDPEPALRERACLVLGKLGGADAAGALRRALAVDPHLGVVAAAERGLRLMDEIQVEPPN